MKEFLKLTKFNLEFTILLSFLFILFYPLLQLGCAPDLGSPICDGSNSTISLLRYLIARSSPNYSSNFWIYEIKNRPILFIPQTVLTMVISLLVFVLFAYVISCFLSLITRKLKKSKGKR